MKHLVKILYIGTALAAPLAHATPISGAVSISGVSDTWTTGAGASVMFPATNPNAAVQSATGTFATYAPSASILTPGQADLMSFSLTSSNAEIFTIGPNAATYIEFTLSAAPTIVSDTTAFLSLAGAGTFTDTAGDAATAGTFRLTSTEDAATGVTTTSFTLDSGVPAAATPEPSSLVLLGSGLVSAAGIVLRRRRSA